MPARIYFTTTLPYVNADPHLGFALEVVTADVLARYHRLRDKEVFFNTGTDEHGEKIYRRAQAENLDPQVYVDGYAKKFSSLRSALDLSYDFFSRTTAPHHLTAATEFWRCCLSAGDIYKKNYRIKYCVGCELEKTDSELENGLCSIHPNQPLEIIEEENYFFRFSRYQERLLELYEKQTDFIIPESRRNEIINFVRGGLQDFSISRLTEKMPWGIPVPDDPTHTMYVWFDALINYVSAIGWPKNLEQFNRWWPTEGEGEGAIQFAGKDNLRQQAAMWQAMLLSAGLPSSRQIVIHGFIISGGQKMSKSIGNVIDPLTLVNEYGTDALRYFLMRHVQPFEDTDVTLERFKELYNANLANGLGNLVSRVMKLAETHLPESVKTVRRDISEFQDFTDLLESYETSQALDRVWLEIGRQDAFIQETKPFELVKSDPTQAIEIISKLVQGLEDLAVCLEPIMPSTTSTIRNLIKKNQSPSKPLFPRY